MLARNYPIFFLFISSLVFGEDSKEETVISREDLVGHYIGSNEDQMVSIELGQFIYKFFSFEDFVTIESFDKGKMGCWNINGKTIEFDDPELDFAKLDRFIKAENGYIR